MPRVATLAVVEKSWISWGTAPDMAALPKETDRVARETAMVSIHFRGVLNAIGFRASLGI
jgi:hypothetical protein